MHSDIYVIFDLMTAEVLNKVTRIVLADDHALVRDGIRSLLEEEMNVEVIGEVSNGAEALKMVAEKEPDLLIIDIRMPEMGGIEAVEALNKQGTQTKCIILSMHDSEEYILKSVKAGAYGYLLKDADRGEFIRAIQSVSQGDKYFSGDISDVLVKNLLGRPEPEPSAPGHPASEEVPFDLTRKELQVLKLVLSGLTNKEISERLQNSQRTIETHRFNLMKKMNVKNLLELSKKAQEHQLT